MKSKILIIQNPETVEEGYWQAQGLEPDDEIIGIVSSLIEAEPLAARQSPDLVILDVVQARAREIIETARGFTATYPCSLVCLLSAVDDEILQGLQLVEPFSYLIKPFAEKELRFAIQLAQRKRQTHDDLITAKKALVESEKQSHELLENLPIGIYRTTPQGKILYANPLLVKLLGYDSFTEMTARNLAAEDFEPSYSRAEFCQRLERENQIIGLEALWKRRDGTSMFVRENVRVLRNAEGAVLYYEGTVEDITNRKHAEEALRESEERYRLLAEYATDLIARHTPAGEYLYASPASRTLLGYEPEEMVGQTIYDFVHPDDAQSLKKLQAAILKTQDTYTQAFRFICKDGNAKWVESTVQHIRDAKTRRVVEVVSVSRDITKRQHAEEALRASEERFRKLAVNSPDYIYLIDLTQKRVVYHNRGYLFGYENAELNNYGFLKSLIYFDDKQLVQDNWLNLLKGNTGSVEFRLRKKDGTWEWLDCRYNALYFDAQGKPLQTLLTISLITERKLAEELLQKYADELQDLYQNAPCGYYSIDSEGTIVRINDTELQWLGYGRDEVIGRKKYWELVRIGDLEFGKQQFSLLKKRGWIRDIEGELIRKDGSTMPILLTATAVKDENNNFIQSRSTIYDMTERQRAEEIIKRTNEQLQALSAHLLSVREEERTRIAREIHDEFGPMLTILKFDLFALGKKLTEDQHDLLEKIWLMSAQIDAAVGSVRKICSDLRPAILDFGLPAAIEWLTTDFEKLTAIKCAVQLKIADLTFTEEVSTALFRILQEGLTNVARHAEATRVEVVLEKVNERLELKIMDNGRGINPEATASLRSFGLLGIRERTRLLGGEATVTGQVGNGTRVQLFVPLAQTKEFQFIHKNSGSLLTEAVK